MTEHDRKELLAKSTVDLRKMVREQGLAKGGIVASAKKEDLIALLMGETTNLPDASVGSEYGAAGFHEDVTPTAEKDKEADAASSAMDVLAAALGDRINVGIDKDAVAEIVSNQLQAFMRDSMTDREVEALFKEKLVTFEATMAERIAALSLPIKIEIKKHDQDAFKSVGGLHHFQFPTLVRFATARDKNGCVPPVYMHGPAGTGKTTAASNLADALDLPFYFNGAIDSEYKLSGFVDAGGTFRSRPFYEAYSNGGVYLFDELDSSLPSAVLAFNAALANGHADFPIGKVDRHKDCIILAAGNTALRGDGAQAGFQRMEQDAAFRDRFVFLSWPIDEALESACVPADDVSIEWKHTVRRVRENVKTHGIKKADITPRATFAGIALLANGIDRQTVIDSVLRKGIPDEQWSKMSEGI